MRRSSKKKNQILSGFGTPGFHSPRFQGWVLSQRRFPQAGQRRGAPASHAGSAAFSAPARVQKRYFQIKPHLPCSHETRRRARRPVPYPFLKLFTTLRVQRALYPDAHASRGNGPRFYSFYSAAEACGHERQGTDHQKKGTQRLLFSLLPLPCPSKQDAKEQKSSPASSPQRAAPKLTTSAIHSAGPRSSQIPVPGKKRRLGARNLTATPLFLSFQRSWG